MSQILDDSVLPWSLVTLHIKSGYDLPKKDVNGSSDPYVQVTFKGQTMTTDFIDKNIAPKWFKKFHFVVGQGTDDQSDQLDMKQELLFTVYDHDYLSKNDALGEYRMTLGELLRQRRNGDIHLSLEPVRQTVIKEG